MNRLLILGGGRYNVPSIQSARENGFRTFVADKNPEAPGLKVADYPLAIDLNDCESLIGAVQQHGGIDGVVSMAEVGVRAAAHIAARLGLPSVTEEAAARATSKASMRRSWQKLGAYSPAFEVVSSEAESCASATRLGFPLVFKPDRSFGGSRGVTRVEQIQNVVPAFRAARTGGLPGSEVVIEECIEGTEHSCEVLIWEEKTSTLCIGQKVKSLLPYRVDVSVQYPARLTAQQETQVAVMCDRAVKSLGLTQGVAHVEFGYGEHGPMLYEIGARCGGGHTPQIAHHVSGVDEFVEACRMACGMAPSQFLPKTRRGADYRFLIFPPGVIHSVNIPESLRIDNCVLDVGLTVKPGDTIRPLRSTSERAGFLVATSSSLDEAVELANRGCREIFVEYADGGKHHALELTEFRELAHS